MTCFWDGLINGLDKNIPKPTVTSFIQHLKNNNTLCYSVNCNGYILSIKFLYECKEAINNYNINDSNNGYLCSTCDPFLILYSQLYNVNINHKYNGIDILYNNYDSKKTIYFESNLGHFWFVNFFKK